MSAKPQLTESGKEVHGTMFDIPDHIVELRIEEYLSHLGDMPWLAQFYADKDMPWACHDQEILYLCAKLLMGRNMYES